MAVVDETDPALVSFYSPRFGGLKSSSPLSGLNRRGLTRRYFVGSAFPVLIISTSARNLCPSVFSCAGMNGVIIYWLVCWFAYTCTLLPCVRAVGVVQCVVGAGKGFRGVRDS